MQREQCHLVPIIKLVSIESLALSVEVKAQPSSLQFLSVEYNQGELQDYSQILSVPSSLQSNLTEPVRYLMK